MRTNLDDEIERLDNEITDVNTAKLRAKELGMRPGDYDLSTASAAAGKERKDNETTEATTTTSSAAPVIEKESRDYIPTEELPYSQDEYQKALSDFRGYQEKLSEEFFKKNTGAKEYYDKAVTTGMKGRDEVISSMETDPYLDKADQERVLGEDYQNFLNARNLLTMVDKQKYGSSTAGTKESAGDAERFGLRNALLFKYTGPERTEEDRLADVEYLKSKQTNP